jgi:hypothetical protein
MNGKTIKLLKIKKKRFIAFHKLAIVKSDDNKEETEMFSKKFDENVNKSTAREEIGFKWN